MDKHNKDLEKIRVGKDFFKVILMQMNANYWKLKTNIDSLSVEYNKL
jgi:hypothetical protein